MFTNAHYFVSYSFNVLCLVSKDSVNIYFEKQCLNAAVLTANTLA